MRRTIVDVIENFLADYLLSNDVQRGDTISITLNDIQKYVYNTFPPGHSKHWIIPYDNEKKIKES
jgi:ATP-dependent Clp protease ATP-binding subunit ClpA